MPSTVLDVEGLTCRDCVLWVKFCLGDQEFPGRLAALGSEFAHRDHAGGDDGDGDGALCLRGWGSGGRSGLGLNCWENSAARSF